MKLLKLEFKNIGSYGDKIETIDLNGKSELTLIQGKNGKGKCLHHSTSLTVKNESLDGITTDVTIGHLYTLLSTHKEAIKHLKVETLHGWKSIEAIDITARDSKTIAFKTQGGKSIISSPDHLFWSPESNNWKAAKEFKIGDNFQTIVGLDPITHIEHSTENEEFLYDIQVEDVKEFWANGIRSHNSTIAKALVYTLFGKVEGIKLSDIPNRVNKNAWSRATIESKGKLVVIERGQAPSHFKLLIDGNEFDQAGKKDVQKYLEEEFLGFNFNVFTNIIILSINDFKSFLTMTPRNKRDIIDKIFGFTVINDMREIVKNDVKELKYKINSLESSLSQIDSTISHTIDRIVDLEEKGSKEAESKLKELKATVISYTKSKSELKAKYDKLVNKLSEQRNRRKSLLTENASLKEQSITLNKTLKLYENSACPVCQSPLDTPFHEEIVNSTKADIDKVKVNINKVTNSISEADKVLNKAREFERDIIKNIQKFESLIASKRAEIAKFASSTGANVSELKRLIDEFTDKKAKQQDELNSYSEEETFLNILSDDILSDEGVKLLAVRAVVPVLNRAIEKFSTELESQFNVEFDENFNCLVKHLGEEVNPNTLSEGERKKTDLIIIIALIEILKLRYPQMNLLFLDELFSSLDQENINKILFTLKHMLESLNLNIFVINHTELPVQMFDKIIHVVKNANFSSFNVYTDLNQTQPNEE